MLWRRRLPQKRVKIRVQRKIVALNSLEIKIVKPLVEPGSTEWEVQLAARICNSSLGQTQSPIILMLWTTIQVIQVPKKVRKWQRHSRQPDNASNSIAREVQQSSWQTRKMSDSRPRRLRSRSPRHHLTRLPLGQLSHPLSITLVPATRAGSRNSLLIEGRSREIGPLS